MNSKIETGNFFWLDVAKKLQAIAQTGLKFTENKYDVERYEIIRELSINILHNYTKEPVKKITDVFAFETGYQTPKLDIRGVVFRNDKILMIKEEIDGKWTLPGGWADIGLSPFEIAEKEVFEEAGLQVKPQRLLGVYHKAKDAEHPQDYYDIYKLFILCTDLGGEIKTGLETTDVGWFGPNEIPELSTPRITSRQIKRMFDFLKNPDMTADCD